MSTGNIGKIKASRVNNVPNVESYLGEKGILFYNYANGVIRMSDGITPGGVPIPYTVASVSTVGGIKAGPGANIAADGTLTIDTAGLPLSIGNLEFEDTTISTLQPNVDLNIETNGTGVINMVGNLHIHTTSEGPYAPAPVISVDSSGVFTANANVVTNGNLITFGNIITFGTTFRNGPVVSNGNVVWNGNTITNGSAVNNGDITFNGNIVTTGNTFQTGISRFVVATNSMNTGALTITGNLQGLVQQPALPGVMLHVTGQDNGTTPSRSYFDGVGQYAILVGRRYNGNIATPTQAVAGDEVFRLAGTGYPTGGWPLTGLAQIRFIADENQTQTNRGGHLDFLTVPIGSNVVTQVMSLSATTGANISGNLVASNVTATNFYGTATRVSSNLTAGFGLAFSSGTTYNGSSALTLNKYDAVTGPVTPTGAGANGWTYTLDMGTCDGVVVINPGGAFTGTITLNGTPVVGKTVRVLILNMQGAPKITVSGLTATNSTNGTNQFAAVSGNQSVGIVEFFCTTTALSGVYMNLSGAK